MSALVLALAVLIGDPFPSLSLAAPTGEPAALEPRGRITVVDLFATWCGPCRESLPALERLRRKFARDVDFVSIAEEADGAKVAAFARERGLGARLLLDAGGAAYRRLGAHRLPTTYVVDAAGVVRRINHGYGAGYEARLAGWLSALVAERR